MDEPASRLARLIIVISMLPCLGSCGDEEAAVPSEPASAEPVTDAPREPAETQPASWVTINSNPPRLASASGEPPPETAPAGSGTSDRPPAFEPLRDAVGGERTRYAALDDRILEYEIVKVAVTRITTRVVVYAEGKPLGLPATRDDAPDHDPVARHARRAGARTSVRRETIECAGRTWDTLLYEDRWRDEDIDYVRRTWVCEDVPVFGIVRMDLLGNHELETQLTLIDHETPEPAGTSDP